MAEGLQPADGFASHSSCSAAGAFSCNSESGIPLEKSIWVATTNQYVMYVSFGGYVAVYFQLGEKKAMALQYLEQVSKIA